MNDPVLEHAGVSLSILRCDLIHPELSGNKWFKLKYNLQTAKERGHRTLLSFGGAWSNHIHALAAAGKIFDFKTIGVIRGDGDRGQALTGDKGRGDIGQALNPCLTDAVANGMNLHWVSRGDYRQKQSPAFIRALAEELGDFYLIPEGGANLAGIKGCGEILQPEHTKAYDLVCLACGTGTTLTGLVSVDCPPVLGFQILKGAGYLTQEVKALFVQYSLKAANKWSINEDYHFGGYGKTTPELLRFMSRFEENTEIPLEPVYSGKMLFGLFDLIKSAHFRANTRILVVHGGGLQGARGFEP